MPPRYSDQEITALIDERKPLPEGWRPAVQLRAKRGHKEREIDVLGDAGNQFRLILRQNDINPLDFSVILVVQVPGSNQMFRLLRYNGKHGEHTNLIEGDTFYDFHVHKATGRYQEAGTREDAYAERTDRYADLRGALACAIREGHFEIPPEAQGALFEEM